MHVERPVHSRPAFFSVALTAIVFLIDLSLPLGVAAAVPYTFAVLLALRSPLKWFRAGDGRTLLDPDDRQVGHRPGARSTEMWKVIANRCLALFAIGMTTFLGIRRKQAEKQPTGGGSETPRALDRPDSRKPHDDGRSSSPLGSLMN